MKLKIIFLICGLSIMVSFIGCSSTMRPAMEITYELPYEDFITRGQHLNFMTDSAIVGDTLVITLGSNPTTGFIWPDIAQISNQDILKQTDHKFISSSQTEGVGASDKDIWTFKVTKAGTATILMNYSRPWEGVDKEEWTFKAIITVR